MAKEIHFHLDFPYDPDRTFHTYDGTNYAIEKGREIIHTTSIANISFDLLDLGYRIFVHRNGRVLECKLGSMDGTEKEIRKAHNLLKLIMGHVFDRYFATGALLEVRLQDIDTEYPYICDMQGEGGTLWKESELEFLEDESDYWTRLEHQYAGMAMQQLVTLVNMGYEHVYEETAIVATNFAHALVEKLKEKEEK